MWHARIAQPSELQRTMLGVLLWLLVGWTIYGLICILERLAQPKK